MPLLKCCWSALGADWFCYAARLANIGLKRPESWTRTLIIGVGLAAIVSVAIYLSEKAGFRCDLGKFKDVHGNPDSRSSCFYDLWRRVL